MSDLNDLFNTGRINQDQEIAALWERWQKTPEDIKHEVTDVIASPSAKAREAMKEWPDQWIDFILCAAMIGLRETLLQCNKQQGN